MDRCQKAFWTLEQQLLWILDLVHMNQKQDGENFEFTHVVQKVKKKKNQSNHSGHMGHK